MNLTAHLNKFLLAATLLMAQVALPVLAEPQGTHWLTVGDSVEVDRIQASTPGGSMWTTGKILEVHRNLNSYLVDVDGSKLTIINSDKWIKSAPADGNAADGAAAFAQVPAANPAPGSAASHAGGGQFKVGDTVMVDIIMASSLARAMWSSAKVIAVNSALNSVLIETPDGSRKTMINQPQWIKPGRAANPAEPNAQAAPKAPELPKNAPNKPAPRGARVPEWEQKKGLGAPPNGTYVVHKISGRADIDVGVLVIRGNTYRGIVRGEGATSAYTMDGDHIVWTNGLEGLPKRDKLVSSKYVGPDERGRPLIEIYYESTIGAMEILDAYRVSN